MEQNEQTGKIRIYLFIILGLLAVLVMRLVIVQIFNSDQYQTRARDNRVRLLPIKATRGEIYAADGTVLAGNELVYTVNVSAKDIKRDENAVRRLVEILGEYYDDVTEESVQELLDNMTQQEFQSTVIKRKVPWDLIVKLEENRKDIPGLEIGIESLRTYPQQELAGHVLGYIHSISQTELEEAEESVYQMDSLIGKTGIERQYEEVLRGTVGARRVEVDSRGHLVQELVTLEPEPGDNLYLTLDMKLQTVMDEKMNEVLRQVQRAHPKARVASAVLLDVKTGKVLAMSSKPDMYPDDWKGNISTEKAAYYFPQGERYDPMDPGAASNRAIQSSYPPGSTFKPITGMAAIDAGLISPAGDYVNCAGRYWIAPYIRCTGYHGSINFYQAMAVSCNVYFQEAGRRAGHEEIIRVAREFGLGERTGVDLPYETRGNLPTPEWKKEINEIVLNQSYDAKRERVREKYSELIAAAATAEEKTQLRARQAAELDALDVQYEIDYNFDTVWQPYDTFNMSIGQGSNSYTALQLANYVATLANGGNLMRPYLVEKIVSNDGTRVNEIQPQVVRHVDVQDNTLAETRRGMLSVTRPGGTASSLFNHFPGTIQVGAKTGTAESGRAGDRALTDTHGVFVAFAPYDDPQIAFAGIVEYGYSGFSSAGLVCQSVFEQYFGLVDHYQGIMERRQAAAAAQE